MKTVYRVRRMFQAGQRSLAEDRTVEPSVVSGEHQLRFWLEQAYLVAEDVADDFIADIRGGPIGWDRPAPTEDELNPPVPGQAPAPTPEPEAEPAEAVEPVQDAEAAPPSDETANAPEAPAIGDQGEPPVSPSDPAPVVEPDPGLPEPEAAPVEEPPPSGEGTGQTDTISVETSTQPTAPAPFAPESPF